MKLNPITDVTTTDHIDAGVYPLRPPPPSSPDGRVSFLSDADQMIRAAAD